MTDRPRVLGLCAGYGGLEMAVNAVTGGHPVAFAEMDPYASQVFSTHNPGVPNLGDITAVDWRQVVDRYAPDIITAGFPCQDISNAGPRKGITGARSGVWKSVVEAVGVIRPGLVFLENVAAIRSRGLGTVVGDLAAIGYDARWTCLRAGDPEVGAPHPRDRWSAAAGEAEGRWAPPLNEFVVNLLPTPKASDGPHGGPNQRDSSGRYYLPGQAVRLDELWLASNGTDYGPAIRRWENTCDAYGSLSHRTGRTLQSPPVPGVC